MIIRHEHTLDKEEYQSPGLSQAEIEDIMGAKIGIDLLRKYPPTVFTHDDGEENYNFEIVTYKKVTTQAVRSLLEANINETNKDLFQQIIKLLFYDN